LIVFAISICAYAAGTNTKKPKKSQKGWKRIVWVDEKGIRHVTLVSARVKVKGAEEEAAPPPGSGAQESLPRVITSKVASALDVESIRLADGRVVRYIGVKGPPKNTPLYKQALEFHKKKVVGKWVNVLPGTKPRAADGSIWAHVFVNRMTFINAELIRYGWARANPVKPNLEYRILFARLEKRASSRNLGMWKK